MRGFGLILLSWALCSCSLLVQFDPETQPCDSAGACQPGYACSDAGLCAASDAGVTDGGGLDGSTCTAHETNCADGRDEDCDNLTDCADPDCAAQRCDDHDACTTGETCTAGGCGRGTALVCNTPPSPCQAQNGTCTAGGCTYPPRADGTSCGAAASDRCCTGTCINMTLNGTNCGGCGLSCATGQMCQPINQSACGLEPINTSGRCSCTVTAPCPGGQTGVQTCGPDGSCKPTTPTQCAPGQSVGDGGLTCGTYCHY